MLVRDEERLLTVDEMMDLLKWGGLRPTSCAEGLISQQYALEE